MKLDLLADLLALRGRVNDMIDAVPLPLATSPQLLERLTALHGQLTAAANVLVETQIDLSTRGLEQNWSRLRAVSDQLDDAADVIGRVDDVLSVVSQAMSVASAIIVALA